MAIPDLVLNTNKSSVDINNDRIIIRQSERGLILTAIIKAEDGTNYNLAGKTVQFAENKDGQKLVLDENVQVDSSKQGVIHYTLHKEVYSASGTGWFEIITNQGVVDTTQNFYIDVLKDAQINVDNDNYISSMEAQLNNLKATVQRVDDALNKKLTEYSNNANREINDAIAKCQQALNNATNELNGYQSKYASLEGQWNQTLNKINSDATDQRNGIQAKADQQVKDIQSRADSTNNLAVIEINKIKQDAAVAIQSVNTQRDATIKTAQEKYNQQLSSLQSDYNIWKANLNTDLTAQLKSITDQIASDKSATTQVHNEVVDIQKQIDDAKKAWDSVDFTKFVTGNQFKEAMSKKASGLKVRGLRGDYVMAVNANDSNIDATPSTQQAGLVDSGVLAAAVQALADAILDKNHYTKDEVNVMKQNLLDTVADQIKAVQDQVKTKADNQTVNANTQRITALENAGYIKYKDSGFSSAEEAQQWATDNHGIAIFDDGN